MDGRCVKRAGNVGRCRGAGRAAARSLGIVVCLAFAALPGCLHHELGPAPPPTEAARSSKEAAPAEGFVHRIFHKDTRRLPKAETCTAIGFNRERMAENEHYAPQRDQLRAEAIRAYRKAIELDPTEIKAWQGLARVYEAQGDVEQAVDVLQTAVAKNPTEASLWYDQGMLHARRKHWDASLKCLRTAVEKDPENRLYLKTLGFGLARTGRHEESLACLQKAMSAAEAHCNLGRMLAHLQQPEASRQHLRRALELDPKLALAQQLLDQLDGRQPAAALTDTPAVPAATPANVVSAETQVADLELPSGPMPVDGVVPDPAQLEADWSADQPSASTTNN
jgi:Tfp pilus assembly protein PilF